MGWHALTCGAPLRVMSAKAYALQQLVAVNGIWMSVGAMLRLVQRVLSSVAGSETCTKQHLRVQGSVLMLKDVLCTTKMRQDVLPVLVIGRASGIQVASSATERAPSLLGVRALGMTRLNVRMDGTVLVVQYSIVFSPLKRSAILLVMGIAQRFRAAHGMVLRVPGRRL